MIHAASAAGLQIAQHLLNALNIRHKAQTKKPTDAELLVLAEPCTRAIIRWMRVPFAKAFNHGYSHAEIEAACGVEIAQQVRTACDARRATIRAEIAARAQPAPAPQIPEKN